MQLHVYIIYKIRSEAKFKLNRKKLILLINYTRLILQCSSVWFESHE